MSLPAVCNSEGYGRSVAQPRGRWSPTDEERALVLQKRLLRASWADIARMLRQPVLNVRAIFDPTLDRDFIFKAPEPVDKPFVRARHTGARRYRRLAQSDPTILAALAEPQTTPEIAKLLGWNPSSAMSRLIRMERDGLVRSQKKRDAKTAALVWSLTDAGVAEIADDSA